jgi:hypothetical protein
VRRHYFSSIEDVKEHVCWDHRRPQFCLDDERLPRVNYSRARRARAPTRHSQQV